MSKNKSDSGFKGDAMTKSEALAAAAKARNKTTNALAVHKPVWTGPRKKKAAKK
jgi:predicted metal-dependent phosphotriesterase family hydrolase